MPNTLLLGSGRELSSGLAGVFVVAAAVGLVAVVAVLWTIKLVRTRTALDDGQRRVLLRFAWLLVAAGVGALGVWAAMGAKLKGDDVKLIPLAGVFLAVGIVAVRRARNPADPAKRDRAVVGPTDE